MKTSYKGQEFIKKHEGYSEKPYKDAIGIWTGGYGHVFKRGERVQAHTKEEWEKIFVEDLADSEAFWNNVNANRLANGLDGFQQHHFDALVDFTFNAGQGTSLNSEMYRLAAKDMTEKPYLPAAFCTYTKAGGVRLEGLVARRMRCYWLWMTGKYELPR